MAIYDAGTASLAANGTVTGVGTTWQAPLTLIRVGATIVFKTEPVQIYTISEIISDTQINVYNPNSETVPSGTGYAILAHDGITVQGLAQDVAETLRYYQSQESYVAQAVDAFANFDANDFDTKVTQVNNQYGEVITTGAQVSADSAQVANDKNAAAASAASALSDKNAAAASAQEAAGYAASLNVDLLVSKEYLSSEVASSNSGRLGGFTVQSAFSNLLSTYGGDLQLAINSSDEVLIDMDYTLSSTINLRSNLKIKTINGKKITKAKNGFLRTPAITTQAYYGFSSENMPIDITNSPSEGGTTLTLSSSSGIKVDDKLVLRNGYCDMWRVLESGDSELQRRAVDSLTFMTEIVTVTAIDGNTLTISPLRYSYPLSPKLYGYVDDENALSAYAGLTKPTATKLLYKNISIDADFFIPSGDNEQVMKVSYIDGFDFSARIVSGSAFYNPFVITNSVVNIHDVYVTGHRGGVLWVQEASQGVCSNLNANGWDAGHDSPFICMLLSNLSVSSVFVKCRRPYSGTSAFYFNACDGGSISSVFAENCAKVVDLSFSRQINASVLTGKNCDFAASMFASSGCSASNASVDGYCLQNSSTSIYTGTLVYIQNNTNCKYHNIRRLNDKGYGRIRINGTYGCEISSISAPKTTFHCVIESSSLEVAKGENNLICQIDGLDCGGFIRESSYYDSTDEYGPSYPMIKAFNVRVMNSSGTISIGRGPNKSDSYEFFSPLNCEIGKETFGVHISGRLGSISVSSTNRLTCYPYIAGLTLENKPTPSQFMAIDSNISSGLVNQTHWGYGVKISDVYSTSTYTNMSSRGEEASWTKS